MQTNYDAKKNFFDTSEVEAAIDLIIKSNMGRGAGGSPVIVIKSAVPVGYTKRCRAMFILVRFCGQSGDRIDSARDGVWTFPDR